MNKSIDKTRVILIGGSSHVGKSTLSRSMADKLGWSFLSTDSLARHPGRPWINASKNFIPKHVKEYYKTLSSDALFLDVLSHYETNVLPQVEAIVHSHTSDLSKKCLIIEGSALYPTLVVNLVKDNNVKAIWLTASDRAKPASQAGRLFRKRILSESNFDNVGEEEKYLIQKFLDRTLLYNDRMRKEIEQLGFLCLDVESVSTADELTQKCLELMECDLVPSQRS